MLILPHNFYAKGILIRGDIHVWLKCKYKLIDMVNGYEYNLIFKLVLVNIVWVNITF